MIRKFVQEDAKNWHQTLALAPGGDHLSPSQLIDLSKLQAEFADVFSPLPGRTNLIQHHIETEPGVVVRSRPYRLPEHKKKVVQEELGAMLESGVIEESNSNWASPIVLVPKTDGSVRFCVDYRKVNAVSKFDAYPMPRVDELLDRLGTIEGEERPVLYISRKLSKRETKYSTVEKECLAIRWAILTLCYYLLGREFTLCSDHAPLQWLHRMKDTNAQITRWYLALQPFKFNVVHKPGVQMAVADFLSINCAGGCRPDGIQHHIETDPGVVVRSRPYRLPEHKKKVVQEELGAMLERGVIEESNSNWASPIVLVPKTDGSVRFCVDYRKVNAVSKFDAYPMPRVDELLDRLGTIEGEERPVLYISRKLSKRETKYSTLEKECLAIRWAVLTLCYYLLGREFTLCYYLLGREFTLAVCEWVRRK